MKKRYDLGLPDLTPDLEWMLSSGQVSSALLLEKLLQDYYPKLYQLAFSILNDRALAGRCAQDIFVIAMLSAHRFSSGTGVEIWLYQIAWQQCQKANQHQKFRLILKNGFPSVANKRADETLLPENPLDARLWQAVDGLGEFPRSVLMLHALHGWPVEMIEVVTGAATAEVQAVLDAAQQEISAVWEKAGQEVTEFSETLFRLFSSRWPAPAAEELDLAELAAGISKQVAGKQSRIKPVATILEVSLLAGVVLIAGIFLVWARLGEDAPQASPTGQVAAVASPTPTAAQRDQSTNSSLLAPRKYPRTSVPSPTPTPKGVLYDSIEGEDLAQIATRLDVALDELRRLNRIAEHELIARDQLLYIPDSLPAFTSHFATPVPPLTYTLPLETPASSEDIFRLIYPEAQTFSTVWFDAILFMHPQLPFSEHQEILRVQLWFSEDQALLLGGKLDEDPEEVLLYTNDTEYIAKPGKSDPWFKPANSNNGGQAFDLRFVYGVIEFLTYGYNDQKYEYLGEESIAGRPAWMIMELNQQLAPLKEISLDKQTGFVLKYRHSTDYPDDREIRAFSPREAMIAAIEYNVDFPQDLFNPRLPWRGGYAWDHSGQPFQFVNTP